MPPTPAIGRRAVPVPGLRQGRVITNLSARCFPGYLLLAAMPRRVFSSRNVECPPVYPVPICYQLNPAPADTLFSPPPNAAPIETLARFPTTRW